MHILYVTRDHKQFNFALNSDFIIPEGSFVGTASRRVVTPDGDIIQFGFAQTVEETDKFRGMAVGLLIFHDSVRREVREAIRRHVRVWNKSKPEKSA